jgi:putative aminopeptidase FrvX
MNRDRLLDSLRRLAALTDTPGNGVTRFSWSESDRKARMFLAQELKALGLAPHQDGIGNLCAVMKGSRPGHAAALGQRRRCHGR